MPVSRSLRAAVTVIVTGATLLSLTAASEVRHHPKPVREGPAGPPARLPDGRVAAPPRLPASMGRATDCPKPSYGAKFYAPGTGKTVALTFDDGPGRSTWQILRILRKYRVPATFFNLGDNEAVRQQDVRDEVKDGFVVGNHTWDHPDLALLSASAQASEMDREIAEQYKISHTRPCVFRPPYGDYNSTTLSLARARRMAVWLWSVDTQDWMADGSGSSYWVHRIISLAESEGGALTHPVVLMHNQPVGNPATVSALPTIIRFFQHNHYHFVSL